MNLKLAVIEPAVELMEGVGAPDKKGRFYKITAWKQGPNENHFLFPDDELEAWAKSFKGQPFLQDHSRRQADRGGTIYDAWLEGDKIRMTLQVVKPWAIEGFEDGTIDRYSIGASVKGVLCSVCDLDFRKDKKHSLDDVGDEDADTKETILMKLRGLRGTEVSAVTHPAVPGTSTDEAVLAQLAESTEFKTAFGDRGNKARGTSEVTQEASMKKILAALGLAETATESEALGAVEQLKAPVERVPPTVLTALGLTPESTPIEACAAVYAITRPDAFVPKADHDATCTELAKLKAEGAVDELVRAGKVTPAQKAFALDKFMENHEAAAKFFENAPVQLPGKNGQAPVPAPKPGEIQLTAEQKEMCRKMRVPEDKFLETLKEEQKGKE